MNTLSPTAQRLLEVVRLRARRLALWMEHLWQTGQSSPDQGPAIGPAEVARLLSPDAVLSAEAAFFADGEAAALSEQSLLVAAEVERDPGWIAICQVFGLTRDEAEFLLLLLAVEIDPGLARVTAYLHDDGRLTQPTPWLAARLAAREAAPFVGANLRRWLLAMPIEGAAPERLTAPWQADPALALAVASSVWQDPALTEVSVLIEPAAIADLPYLHPDAKSTLEQLPDPRDAELVGPPGISRNSCRTIRGIGRFAVARGRFAKIAR